MCYFVVDLAERVSVQFLKIFFAGRHKDAGHIEGAGTDNQLCVAFGSVALRTMGCARNVDGDKSDSAGCSRQRGCSSGSVSPSCRGRLCR